VRLPAALLATKVHRGVAPAVLAGRLFFIFRAIALERGQGLDQCAIHAEVLLRQQIGGSGLLQHLSKELVCHLAFEQPIPVLGEGRVMPDPVVHGETHKPAKQQVVVDLFDQLPFAADGEECHQQLGPQQFLRWNRVSPEVGIKRIELAVQRLEGLIDHPADGAQWMILWYSLLRTHRAEQGVLLYVWASHLQCHRFDTFQVDLA